MGGRGDEGCRGQGGHNVHGDGEEEGSRTDFGVGGVVAMTAVRWTSTTLPPMMVAARRRGWGAILLTVEDFGAANKEEGSDVGEEEEAR